MSRCETRLRLRRRKEELRRKKDQRLRRKRGPRLRGIRRPAVLILLLYLAFLLLLHGRGIPLRRSTEAERYLAEAGRQADLSEEAAATGSGTLTGRISECSLNAGGNCTLILTDAFFQPDASEKKLRAGTVLVYFPPREELRIGYTVCFRGRLEFFRAADNPGEFDAKAYYLSLDLACFMDADALLIEDRRIFPFREAARQTRAWLSEGLSLVFDPDEAGLLSAMLLGDRSRLPEEIKSLYETAGLSHLLSVSGLHVGFLTLLTGRIFGFLLSFFPFGRGKSRLSRGGFLPAKALLAAGAVIFYMILSGGRVPVRRAGLMVLLLQVSLALRLSYDLPSAAAAAALSILIPYPYALFQPSFQLSFLCVLLLGGLLPVLIAKLRCETAAAQGLLLPLTVQMGTLPVSLWHYFCFHPYSAAANLLAVPLAGFILAGGLAAAVLARIFRPAGRIAAGGVHLLLEGIRRLCLLIRTLPAHTLNLGRPEGWQMLLYTALAAAGLLWAFRIRRLEEAREALSLTETRKRTLRRFFRESRRTALLLGLWLLGAASVFLIRAKGTLRLTSLYVGQGDCHVLELPDGSCYLMDAGSSYGAVGESRVLPYLRFRGIRRLKAVIVSHFDSDHVSAVTEILQEGSVRVGSLILPQAWENSPKAQEIVSAAEERRIPVVWTGSGAAWRDGAVSFEVLFPAAYAMEEPDNGSSLVLLLEQGSFAALYTGDLDAPGEGVLMQKYAARLEKLDYLKVSHHGSKYSSTEAFLACTAPACAVISCGRNNVYGHPAPETLARLKNSGAGILRTDRDGAVWLERTAGGRIRLTKYYQEEERLMNKQEEEKISRSTWAACAVIVGIGLMAVCLALWGPKKEADPGTAASASALPAETGSLVPDTLPPEAVTEEGTHSYGTRSEPESEIWPAVLPSSRETVPFSELPDYDVTANAGRNAEGGDPQAAGFTFSQEMTDRLYLLFASEMTNNTDEEDPFRSLAPALKEELDALSERFAAGTLPADALAEACRGLSFVWPQDPYQLRHDVGEAGAHLYVYAGTDMELAKDRILMTNRGGRHYLFLRVYENAAADSVRIYMVNALIY